MKVLGWGFFIHFCTLLVSLSDILYQSKLWFFVWHEVLKLPLTGLPWKDSMMTVWEESHNHHREGLLVNHILNNPQVLISVYKLYSRYWTLYSSYTVLLEKVLIIIWDIFFFTRIKFVHSLLCGQDISHFKLVIMLNCCNILINILIVIVVRYVHYFSDYLDGKVKLNTE